MGKKVIGRYDKIDLPNLNIYNLDVKIDTGAYTSSIHCESILEKTINGRPAIVVQFLDSTYEAYHKEEITIYEYDTKVVKNSFGHSEARYLINTKFVIFGDEFFSKLTLTTRDNMKFPALLGRKLLNNRYIVDTTLKNLSFTHKTTFL